ncbi:MAG: hemolysin III family protein [Gemmatimonadaceae bacterium]|nr:hemolysin III family protein [Gemmatimonadaceae bacterium]
MSRPQTIGEEIANAVSHGVGFALAVASIPLLVIAALPHGTRAVVGAAVFSATAALLYLTSTLYHSITHPRAKRVLRVLDHSAIYLLIAGTYTPFALGVLRGAWGWSLLGTIWGLAIAGVVVKAVGGFGVRGVSTALYLAMGWLVIVAARPLYLALAPWGLFWLIAGGVAYTAGTVFYSSDRLRFGHFAWHLCVLAGTACHCVAVWRYAAA